MSNPPVGSLQRRQPITSSALAAGQISGVPTGSKARPPAAQAGKSAQVCRNFLLGNCRYGEGCKFAHKAPEGQVVETPRFVPTAPDKIRAATNQKRMAEQEAARALEAEQREAEQKARIAEEEAVQQVQEVARVKAIQKAQEELATRQRQAEDRKAAKRTRDAERERARLAAVAEAARLRKLEAEQEAARQREIRAREEAARRALLAEEEARRLKYDAEFKSQHIVLGSTLITCGAGLEVLGVVSGFDSCRLTIHNLPSDTKVPEIIQFFTAQGINRDDIHILSVHPTNGKRLEAKVLTSADQGGAIAIGLDGIEFRNETLRFDVSENTSMNAMDESSPRQTDTLTISWASPSAAMIAKYSSMEQAREFARTLDRKIVNGRRIRAEMNKPPTGPALRYYEPESVKIAALPVDLSVEAVMELAGTLSVRPIKSNTYNLEEMLLDLRRHLDALADNGMRTFTIDRGRELDGTVSVRARFESWDQANSARASLESKRFRHDSPIMRFSLPPPLHFISTVPLEQFDAQKQLWESLADFEEDKGARVHINRFLDRKIVRIRLSGDDRKAVGALKVRVETLAAGEKLDAMYWHRSFLWVKGKVFLTKVLLETGVYVRSDFKIQALKIYGPEKGKEKARQMIEEEVARLAQLETTVTLKRQSVGYFVRKGLAALKEMLGEDAVTLDLASTPCKLTIRGGEEARHALDTIMEQSLNDMDLYSGGTGSDICPICYDAVSNPFKLGCKHLYCTACIRHYITSAVETKMFPLACMGDEAKCKVPIAIPIIQKFLLRQQYEQLVNIAFSSYLEQHTQDFKYCTTPDCTQIYRANTKTMLKCPSCFAEVCSSCHEEAHEGMNCEERRIRKAQDEKLDENWAAMHNMKRCPACLVWIEKNEGCNHMQCRCGAHICWICLISFPTGGETYQHLGAVHGGAFDEDLARQNRDHEYALALQAAAENRPALGHQVPRQQWEVQNEADRRIQAQLLQARQAEVRDAERRRVERLRLEWQQAEQVREAARMRQELHARQQAEYQRQFREREERVTREAEARRREGGWGCTIM
ncbi:hypothetical protein H0H81_005011 [Sphagnurus paluster]|uniref:RBR-type E3 ubiquitin transferase n=1 Tax=Sphagnurus paluster TaxID=117069 RepID=A0A9P7K568_9AGAR|nr:hypothetical protein H0H81_005011 [Sphagnurus paluster]